MGGKEKKADAEVPCFNEIILKKFLVNYALYSEQCNVRQSPDIVTYVKLCLEDNLSLTRVKI